MPFISLTDLAKISSTILNRIGEIRHPCLLLDLRGKVFSLSPHEHDVSCRFFTQGFYYVEIVAFYS